LTSAARGIGQAVPGVHPGCRPHGRGPTRKAKAARARPRPPQRGHKPRSCHGAQEPSNGAPRSAKSGRSPSHDNATAKRARTVAGCPGQRRRTFASDGLAMTRVHRGEPARAFCRRSSQYAHAASRGADRERRCLIEVPGVRVLPAERDRVVRRDAGSQTVAKAARRAVGSARERAAQQRA
jgi:hypothetical protein